MSSQATILKDGIIYTGGRFEQLDVRIERGTIAELLPSISTSKKDVVIDVAGFAVVPGLINSHDHLEFNLFPQLGSPPYKNYVEWAEDVQKNDADRIERIVQIPLKDRLLWGGYKNLFSGVTTVFHHNPFHSIFRKGFPVRVFERYVWIHSLKLDSRLHEKLQTRDSQICAIHVGEGIDEEVMAELQILDSLGGLDERTVVIHGLAFCEEDLKRIVDSRAALVCCPCSNLYLFGRTAPVHRLANRERVVLGTDSTISGGTHLLQEMRTIRDQGNFTPTEILEMVTKNPAEVLGLNAGLISPGKLADLLLFRPSDLEDPLQSVFKLTSAEIGCVIRAGVPFFGENTFEAYFRETGLRYSSVNIMNQPKLMVGDLPRLLSRLKKYLTADEIPI